MNNPLFPFLLDEPPLWFLISISTFSSPPPSLHVPILIHFAAEWAHSSLHFFHPRVRLLCFLSFISFSYFLKRFKQTLNDIVSFSRTPVHELPEEPWKGRLRLRFRGAYSLFRRLGACARLFSSTRNAISTDFSVVAARTHWDTLNEWLIFDSAAMVTAFISRIFFSRFFNFFGDFCIYLRRNIHFFQLNFLINLCILIIIVDQL